MTKSTQHTGNKQLRGSQHCSKMKKYMFQEKGIHYICYDYLLAAIAPDFEMKSIFLRVDGLRWNKCARLAWRLLCHLLEPNELKLYFKPLFF